MKVFFLIPTGEVTQGMLNKSNSASLEFLPIKTISYIDYYILEVDQEILMRTNVFDNYRPYSRLELETANPIVASQNIRFKGVMIDTVNANSTKTTTYTFDEALYLTGIVFKAHAYTFGDCIEVNVKDPDDNLINTFVSNWYVDDSRFDLEIIKSKVVAGIKVNVIYKNVSALAQAKWSMNFKLWTQ